MNTLCKNSFIFKLGHNGINVNKLNLNAIAYIFV